ncbi:MAG: PD-(D/E)XK nuclease family protein [Endomicrobium sp.]|jgi:putative RecB family exonuclease|nr:PD-(D/E)XK nuclease family protein [Endomicrobium sp.]
MKYGFDRADFKISYSRINTYLFCPYKYKLIYIDNQYIPLNADITFGQIIHKTLEKYHSRGGKDLSGLMECYDESWENKGFATAQQNFEYYRRGTLMLENYFKSFSVLDIKILYTEKSFDANIGKYRFIGIIDRIDEYSDGTKEIMDYKTHLKAWDQQRVDSDLQLTFYVYACKNVFGFMPDKISAYFLSDNIKIYTKRSHEEIENGINLALETAEKIMDDDFSPNTSKCGNCGFKLKCKNSVCLAERV